VDRGATLAGAGAENDEDDGGRRRNLGRDSDRESLPAAARTEARSGGDLRGAAGLARFPS
jgi:hypothetical protein